MKKAYHMSFITISLVVFSFLISPVLSFSQFAGSAPAQDGSVTSGEYASSSSSPWYMAWDNTYLYVAKTGGTNTEPVIMYFDINPTSYASGGVATGSNGSTTGKSDYGTTPNLPFVAKARVFFATSISGVNYAEVTTNTGSGWSSTTVITSQMGTSSGTNREIKVSWSQLGAGSRPSAFNWLGWETSTASPGYIYDQFPTINASGQNATPTMYYYQSVVNTSNSGTTNPFSASFESFTNYNNGSYGYTSSLPTTLYDFTNGSSGSSGTTSLQTSLTINGNVVIENGTLNVTNGTRQTITMVNSSGVFNVFTSAGGHVYGTDNGTNNDLALQVNTGANTTFGGDAGTSNSDDHKFFNITVNGTLALSRGILCKYGTFSVSSGTLQINSNGYVESGGVSPKAAAYTSGNLAYNNVANYNVTDYEWPPSTSTPTNVTIQSTGIITLNDAKTIGGTLTLTSGTLDVSASNYGITLGGDWTNNGGTFTPQSGTITFNSTTGAQAIKGTATSQSFYSITVNKTGQTLSVSGSTTAVGISGTLTLTAGTFAVSSSTLTLSGPYISGTVNNLSTTSSSSLVLNCTGSGPFTLPAFTAIGGLTLNSASQTYNLNSSPTVSGALTLTAGKLSIGSNTLTLSSTLTCSSSNSLVGSSSSNLTISGTVGTAYFSGTTTLNNLTVTSGSVVLGTAMTISGTAQLSTGSGTLRFSASQNINNLTVNNGTTLTVDASTTATITGTYSATSSTVTNNGTMYLNWGANGTQFPGSGVTATMKNITVALTTATNAITWKSSGTTFITGTLTLTSGLITSTLSDLVVIAGGSISGASSSSYINGPLSIATPIAATYTYPVGAGGNYRPVQFTYTATPAVPAFQAVTIYQTEGAMAGLPASASTAVFGARYYTILQYPGTTNYTVGLNNSGVTPPVGGTPEIVRVDASVATLSGSGISFSSPYYTTTSAFAATTTATIGAYTYYANTVALAETAIPLTITASGQSKTYGTALSPLAASYSVSGLVGTDAISSVTLTNSNTGNGNSPATDAIGTYTITPSSPVFSSGSIACYSPTYTTGTLTVNAGAAGAWVGVTSTNFSTASNWANNTVPISSNNITVGTGTTYLPVLTASTTINNLSLASGTTFGLNGQSFTINGAVSGSGTITSTSASSLTLGGAAGTLNFTTGNNTIQNLTLSSSATATLGTQLNIVGGTTPGAVTIGSGATLTTGGNLVLKSDINGTARIAQSAGSISGNVTVERYITSKTARKYSYIGSPVSASVRNSWQQQIYVTGSGTGGAPCGATSGDGGTTDKYNSNGFDVTQNNTSTIYNYNATLVSGSRYVGIANTESTNLIPGTGYIVNIRGNRNSGTVTCANQLTNSSYTAPEAVTLNETGAVTIGDVGSITLNDPAVHPFTLLANPYPCPLSFSAFQADNSIINNNMWTYSPFGNGNYTTYSNGVIANAATGYDNTSGNYIASGQAFFVQANTAGSVTFKEAHKTTGSIPNTQYFGNSANQLIRIGLKAAADNNLLDEIVVRYNSNGSSSYTPGWDASSLSSATQSLASLKGTKRLAIATHPMIADIDATQLAVKSSSVGTYRLSFSDYQGLDNSQSITLVDKFLGTIKDIRTNNQYDFNITSDTASMGNSRFVVLVGAAILPVNFTAITAIKAGEKVNVQWQIANETNIASYEVERSSNGTIFNKITTKKVAGANSYLIEDANLPSNITTLYYRIKAIGTDGTTKYSSIAKLTTNNLQLTTIAIYPNPVQRKLNITLSNAATGNYDVRITNVTGKQVYHKLGASVSSNMLTLDASSFASGVYVLELTDVVGNKLQQKFVKE